MRISILAIGKFENSPQQTLFKDYAKRLKWKIELREFELRNAKNFTASQVKEGEGRLILQALKPSTKLIALDERGKEFSSQAFAKLFSNCALSGESDLTFVIGGSNGLDPEIIRRSALQLSLGKMTLPHLLARVVLIEQIYRAETIISGHPYHRE
ncbi:MAG: 23S rRNA (pseudouridine(1915)-N(3))-methyltransferase RlmH [Proteobacteria bacterium]|nr:23S rRNA (pseudouridine(1915)-N(3))-methyltransferase RlmH [Pseudomonadota bacterium]